MKRIYSTITLVLFLCSAAVCQIDSLKYKIEQITSLYKADVGVAIYGFESKDTLSVNGNRHYPMQSVFKFHIGLTVLHEVDEGRLSLAQKIYIPKKDIRPNTWSPMREDYPNGNMNLSLGEILDYMVAKSDNNGCDILLKLIGGPKTVQGFIDSIGINGFSIKSNEAEMSENWDVQFTNWTTPVSAAQVLMKFYAGEILSKSSHQFMWTLMEKSRGEKRIKGSLPPGTPVAHKMGTSGRNDQGVYAAVNDIGIVTLPNGNHFALSIFISNSKEAMERNEKIAADIAKAAWDYFVK